MKYFFDTEFIEDGKTIDLISIGIVAEDRTALYLELDSFDETKASQWVKDHVLSQLGPKEGRVSRERARDEIVKFVGENPEFWADYGAYDWVSLCQLFGTMMDLPKGWPYFCHDLRQLWEEKKSLVLPAQQSVEHHALNDAEHLRMCYMYLTI